MKKVILFVLALIISCLTIHSSLTTKIYLHELEGNKQPLSYSELRDSLLLEDLNKNKIGTVASDFPFITREGKQFTLHSISSESDILLIFYEPDCSTCTEVLDRIIEDKIINDRIKEGSLIVMAINSGGNKEIWQQHSYKLPESWIVGYEDGTIDYDEVYIFFTSPTIYLLDKNKSVIAKDLTFPDDFK